MKSISNLNFENVNVISLDIFCKNNNIKKIDLIKIDVEGFEKEVIEGGYKTIQDIKPKYIQIEYGLHQIFTNTNLHFFFQKVKNYNIYQLTPNNMRKVSSIDPFSNIYLFSNFVFIRKDIDIQCN